MIFDAKKYNTGRCTMTTTGELRSIVDELELVDAGDAVSYLDDATPVGEESSDTSKITLASCLKYISSADKLVSSIVLIQQ
jgi:hypothetical protein